MSSPEYIQKIQSYLKKQFSFGEAQINIMLPDFIATLEEHMENLEQNLLRGDLVGLGASGHTLKGALVNLGFSELADLAFQIEEGGKMGDTTVDYTAISEQLRDAVNQISLAGKQLPL